MKKAIIAGLALAALAFASVGPAVAGTVDSAYISPPENTGNPTILATVIAKETSHIGHSACTCCSCTTAAFEKKSAITTAKLPAPPNAKPGVVIYGSTELAYGMRDGKAGLVASIGESQGTVAILISTATMADANSLRPGGVALGKLDATSGNSNAPQLLAGTASLTCAPLGITFKI